MSRLGECGERADQQARSLWEDRQAWIRWADQTRQSRAFPEQPPRPTTSSSQHWFFRATPSLERYQGPLKLTLYALETDLLFLWAVLLSFLILAPALHWANASAGCAEASHWGQSEELWSSLTFVRGHLMINQSLVVSCPLAEETPVPLYPGAQHCVWLQLCPPDLRWTSSPDPSLRLTGKFSDKQRPRPLGCGPGLSFSCKLVIFSGICSNTRWFGPWVLNLLLHSASFS